MRQASSSWSARRVRSSGSASTGRRRWATSAATSPRSSKRRSRRCSPTRSSWCAEWSIGAWSATRESPRRSRPGRSGPRSGSECGGSSRLSIPTRGARSACGPVTGCSDWASATRICSSWRGRRSSPSDSWAFRAYPISGSSCTPHAAGFPGCTRSTGRVSACSGPRVTAACCAPRPLHLGALAADPAATVRLRARVLVGRRGVHAGHRGLPRYPRPRVAAAGSPGLAGARRPGPARRCRHPAGRGARAARVLDPRGLAEIDRRFPRRRSERQVRPGRYEVSHLVAVGGFREQRPAADPATTREALLAMLVGPGDASTSPDHVRVVERLADRVPPSWIAGLDDRELLGALEHLVG